MTESSAIPPEASLRCFASAALRLALSLVEKSKAAGLNDEGLNTLLSRKEWSDFGFSGGDERLRVAIIPETAYQSGVENLLKMVGARMLEPASYVLVSTLEEPRED